MNIKKSLQSIDASGSNFYFNDVDVIPENIKAVLINEVVPMILRTISMENRMENTFLLLSVFSKMQE